MKYNLQDEKIRVSGRTIFRDGIRFLGYSGTAVTFRFCGKRAEAVLVSDASSWDENGQAWVAVFADGAAEPIKRFPLEKDEDTYVLYESEKEQDVVLTLMKYSEAEYATCGVKEIITDAKELLKLPPLSDRKLLIIGDSITCGYGVEGFVEDEEFETKHENPMKAYSLRTAYDLQAQSQVVAWNGKGVISAYIGDEVDEVDDSWLIPMLYEYTDAGRERDYFHLPKEQWEKWDHTSYQADIVTVYLGTNDASYTKEIPERNQMFCDAYVAFLERIHETQPHAAILCMLGNMDKRLCTTVEKAVSVFRKKHEDVLAEYLDLPMQLDEDGLGTFWHPTAITQEKTADRVVKKIREMMGWDA